MNEFMNAPINHIKTNDNKWTVIINGECYRFDHTHPEYTGLVECVMVGDVSSFEQMINVGTVIEDWSQGNFEMRDGYLYFEDEQVAAQPTLERLYNNVSQRSVQESYAWSSHKGLPITPEGKMIGYKGVGIYSGPDTKDKMGRELTEGDYVDIYTGNSFRNNVGDECGMRRRQVCDDHTVGCSTGLHVGTYEYAEGWAGPGGVVVLVEFDPADIVSVPSDCECQKMRVSDYKVLEVVREPVEQEVWVDDDEYGDDMYGDLYDSDYEGYDQGGLA
jgi:hypothetical protein